MCGVRMQLPGMLVKSSVTEMSHAVDSSMGKTKTR